MTVLLANTSQLGNNAVVNATGADDDGQLELIIRKESTHREHDDVGFSDVFKYAAQKVLS